MSTGRKREWGCGDVGVEAKNVECRQEPEPRETPKGHRWDDRFTPVRPALTTGLRTAPGWDTGFGSGWHWLLSALPASGACARSWQAAKSPPVHHPMQNGLTSLLPLYTSPSVFFATHLCSVRPSYTGGAWLMHCTGRQSGACSFRDGLQGDCPSIVCRAERQKTGVSPAGSFDFLA